MNLGNLLPVQAEHLRVQRKKHGYTQPGISEILGCTVKTYRSWEKGKTIISSEFLVHLSDLFCVSCDYLLGKIEEKNHDVKFVCEYTGLSEESVEALVLNAEQCLEPVDILLSEQFSRHDGGLSILEQLRWFFHYNSSDSQKLDLHYTGKILPGSDYSNIHQPNSVPLDSIAENGVLLQIEAQLKNLKRALFPVDLKQPWGGIKISVAKK